MSSIFFTLKIIHIISACVLFGTGIGTACYLLIANRSKNLAIITTATKHVIQVSWIFITTAGIIQALTGFAMVRLLGFSFLTLWIAWAIVGYCFAAICWLFVVYFQIQMYKIAQNCLQQQQVLSPQYYVYYRYWFIIGWPMIISLIFVYYLMVATPVF